MLIFRLFIAIDPPEDTINKLTFSINSLKDFTSPRIKWVNPENIHLTLKFLGGIAENKIPSIINVLNFVSGKQVNFDLTLGKLGSFPNWRKARIIWVGIEKSEKLNDLAKTLDMRFLSLGFPQETRPFSPHITLGRVKENLNQKEYSTLENETKKAEKIYGHFTVRSICLYESQLYANGPMYSLKYSAEFQQATKPC